LGDRVRPLPADGSVPGMPGWRWLHTPGHTAGHVSLFRDEDRVLIAGDAFTTVAQESFLAVLTQARHVHRPPAYFPTDWSAAPRRGVTSAAPARRPAARWQRWRPCARRSPPPGTGCRGSATTCAAS